MTVNLSHHTELRIQRLMQSNGIDSADELLNISLDRFERSQRGAESFAEFVSRAPDDERNALGQMAEDGLLEIREGKTTSGEIAMAHARQLVAKEADRQQR